LSSKGKKQKKIPLRAVLEKVELNISTPEDPKHRGTNRENNKRERGKVLNARRVGPCDNQSDRC